MSIVKQVVFYISLLSLEVMADSLNRTSDARCLVLKDVLIFISRLAALDS